jgi:hypothetical protein
LLNVKDLLTAVLRIRYVPISRIQDPDFYPFQIPDLRPWISDPGYHIPDPRYNSNKRVGKKFLSYLFLATNPKFGR